MGDNQTEFLPFKKRVTREERIKETKRKRELYPNLVPIILESQVGHSSLPQLDRPKYLVSEDLRLFDLQLSIRGKLHLNKSDSLFFYVGGKELNKLDSDLKTIYNRQGDEDGFLYITYSNLAFTGSQQLFY